METRAPTPGLGLGQLAFDLEFAGPIRLRARKQDVWRLGPRLHAHYATKLAGSTGSAIPSQFPSFSNVSNPVGDAPGSQGAALVNSAAPCERDSGLMNGVVRS